MGRKVAALRRDYDLRNRDVLTLRAAMEEVAARCHEASLAMARGASDERPLCDCLLAVQTLAARALGATT